MIEKFVEIWDAKKDNLKKKYSEEPPNSYDQIVHDLVEMLANDEEYGERPDPNRITVIDHGDYQGYRLWVVGANGYQPSTYWATSSYYGSCSGCDTFQAIQGYRWEGKPDEKEVEGYMILALHLLQRFHCITE